MQITWNLVAKNLTVHEQLKTKIRKKIAKLEDYLQHFPQGSVHLHTAIEQQIRRKNFIVNLTLRIPSNILRSSKTAADPVVGFDHAVKVLLREISKLKADLRKEHSRRAKSPFSKAKAAVRFAASPLPTGKGPQAFEDVLHDLIQDNFERLMQYVRRDVERAEANGDIPRGSIDAEVVVDEVARQALEDPCQKLEEISYRTWFYALANKELGKCYRSISRQLKEKVSLEQPRKLSEADEKEDGYGPEQPLEVIEKKLGPPFVETGCSIPDGHSSPDEELDHKDFIEYLQVAAKQWPEQEQRVFELYFLENLEPDEIAVVEKMKLPAVRGMVSSIQDRLRDVMSNAVVAHVRSS